MADAGTLDRVYDFIPLLRGPAPSIASSLPVTNEDSSEAR